MADKVRILAGATVKKWGGAKRTSPKTYETETTIGFGKEDTFHSSVDQDGDNLYLTVSSPRHGEVNVTFMLGAFEWLLDKYIRGIAKKSTSLHRLRKVEIALQKAREKIIAAIGER